MYKPYDGEHSVVFCVFLVNSNARGVRVESVCARSCGWGDTDSLFSGQRCGRSGAASSLSRRAALVWGDTSLVSRIAVVRGALWRGTATASLLACQAATLFYIL
jgi:hypothetical protein